MPKELFFQGDPVDTLDDLDRVAFGQPGVPGAKNVLWSKLKELLGAGSALDSIKFNLEPDPPVVTEAGMLLWNGEEYTIDIVTGLGATIQVGQETLLLYYNDTGAQLDNFTILHPKAAAEIGGIPVPTPEKADASKWELCEGTLSVATHNIPDGQLGLATRFGKASGGNTTGLTPGAQLWLSADGSGMPTLTKPQFPNYSISMGGSLKEDATEGAIFVSITRSVTNTYDDAWDGGIRESFDFTVSSDGSVVTGLLQNVNSANNLTLFFSDGAVFYTLDTTTTPATIALTAGTDSDPVTNYVYIPIATKVLTVSLSGFPTTEHCKVAQLEVQSAATVQTELGAERNQNINDHIKKEDNNGHILHMAERIRQLNAEHDNGTEATLTGTPTNGYLEVTGGQVWQMHKQTFASFAMPTRNVIISNDFTTPNRRTNNLNTISTYSTGASWNNNWAKIVVWGVANKTGEPDFVKVNLPSDGYNTQARAIADALNYADYTIPKKYKGVGFLIAAFTVRISGGEITYNGGTAYQDLRGFIPNNIAGGGGGAGVTSLLALSDVFITDYVGKKGEAVVINDLETGVVSEAKGWLWNAARTFKHILTSNADADYTQTLQDKDGIIALLSDLVGTPTLQIQTLEVVLNSISLDWNNKNNLKGATVIEVSASVALITISDDNAHFASFYLNIINTPTTVLSFGQYFNSPDENFNNTNGEFTPQEDGEYGFGIELVDGVYFLLITPPIN